MNFYELYQLIKEDTISQYLDKKTKKESFNKIANALKHQTNIIMPDLSKNSQNAIVKFFIYQLIQRNKHTENFFDQLETSYAEYLFTNWLEGYVAFFLIISQNNNGNLPNNILSKLNNISSTQRDLEVLNDEWHRALAKKRAGQQKGAPGKIILNLSDGYKWVNLEKGRCDVEAKSMGHCGNAGAREGDGILSLRDKNDVPHLTFIVNNGELGEMKGRGNDKPSPKYHKHIIELLKLPIIRKVVGGGYLPENNFKLMDLDDDNLKKLLEDKPELEESYAEERLNFAKSNNTSKETLLKLSKDKSDIIRDLVASNRSTPVQALIILSKDKHHFTRASVAMNPNATHEILSNLSKDEDQRVRLAIATNINVYIYGQEILENLCKDNSKEVKYAIINRIASILKHKVKEEREFDPSRRVDRRELVGGSIEWGKVDASDELKQKLLKILSILSKDVSHFIRGYIAEKVFIYTPNEDFNEILNDLSKDKDELVRLAVAENPGTPKEILLNLAKDKDEEISSKAKEILFRRFKVGL